MKSDLSFEQAVEYIKSLDMYGSVLGLDNMRVLAKALGNPEDSLRFVHVTGTNGKGSACAFLSNTLVKAGYKVGSYNSPSVIDGIDQFKINMKHIRKKLYAKAISIVRAACATVASETGNHPTRFEVETMAAFVAFSLEKCDIVVLETGLGGRDDATNIINTEILHVFMPISLDHSEVLGNTLEDIARVKAGIIKNSVPTVICCREEFLESDDGPESVIESRCREMNSKVYKVTKDLIDNIRISNKHLVFDLKESEELELTPVKIKLRMKGAYQPLNALVAFTAAKVLSDIGFNITEDNIKKAFKKTKIPFRFQEMKIDNMVDIILDGAHNPDGARKFVKSLQLNYPDREKIYVTGIFKDKDYAKIAEITGSCARKIYVIQNEKSARSLDKAVLAEEYRKYCDDVIEVESVQNAIDKATDDAKALISANATHPVVCCFGSLSWLNEAKEYIKSKRRAIRDIKNK